MEDALIRELSDSELLGMGFDLGSSCGVGVACAASGTPLPAPTGFSCTAATTQLWVSWNAVAGADSYAGAIQLAVHGSTQTRFTAAGTSKHLLGVVVGHGVLHRGVGDQGRGEWLACGDHVLDVGAGARGAVGVGVCWGGRRRCR